MSPSPVAAAAASLLDVGEAVAPPLSEFESPVLCPVTATVSKSL